MPESHVHLELVALIERYVQACNPRQQILVDLPSGLGQPKPPLIGGYRPDVYAPITQKAPLFIGEAKTVPDLTTEHSKQQIKAFIGHLKACDGGVLCISTSWDYVNFVAESLRCCTAAQEGPPVKCVVISEADLVRELTIGAA